MNNQETNILEKSNIPKMSFVGMSSQEDVNYTVGSIDEDMLTLEEKERVEKYSNEIDVTNTSQIVSYGLDAQRNISSFSSSILEKVKTYDMGEVGETLKELTNTLDLTIEKEKKGILGLFQKTKRNFNAIRTNYVKAETNVNRIEEDLLKHESILVKDIDMYQKMYDLNLQYCKELTIYILAGKKALQKAKEGRLSELKNLSEYTNKQENIQMYKDFEDMCYRFEKKLTDMEITRVISIQSAPQVRMLQNNDREMLDKLQGSIANTIPLWRNQLVLSLGIENTRQAIDAQNILTDKTNELMRKNSETLKMASIETAKAVERSIIDIDTLKQCNNDLITSIDEILKIHSEGKIKRVEVREELLKIELELKNAMINVGK